MIYRVLVYRYGLWDHSEEYDTIPIAAAAAAVALSGRDVSEVRIVNVDRDKE